jgi:hypothetical protein
MERAGDVLKDLLKEGSLRRGNKYISFFRSWEEIAGETLSYHAKAIDVKHGSLIVEVDHPGWFQMFQFKEREILRRVKERFPELKIRDIRVRVTPKLEGKTHTGEEQEEEVDEMAHKEVFEEVGKIGDEDLRRALGRLYGEILKKGGKEK